MAAGEAAGRDVDGIGVKVGLDWPGDLAGLAPYVEALEGLGVPELLVAPATAGVDLRTRLDALAALAT